MKLLQARPCSGPKALGLQITQPSRRHGSRIPPARRPLLSSRRLVIRASSTSDEEPDWDKEMSIFTKRTMAPNQLATLREMESKVSVGKVLWSQDGLAIISGINPDAPLGTKLSFINGGTGVLLWHRSDNLAFALVLGGESSIGPGEYVECKIKGVLQVIDESKGPITRKDYELWAAPAGNTLFGKVFDLLGQVNPAVNIGSTAGSTSGGTSSTTAEAAGVLGFERTKPLINQQVAMKNREQISESLFTGVKGLDTLTPLGRGASLLVIGPNGSGKSLLAVDALLGQHGSGVKSVLGTTTMSTEELQQVVETLSAGGVLNQTAIVSCPPDATLGRKLATLCAAAAVGERVRDEGGHALMILDDVAPLIGVWEALVAALAGLGQEALREGLIKDEEGRDISLNPQTEQELVDYEGMLVSGAVAQRRGFFSTLLLRPAKLHKAFGGGSMSLLPLIPGRCATGVKKTGLDMSKYQTLSEEQKAKIKAALEKKAAEEAAAAGGVGGGELAPGEVTTEFVEEFISICDGQVVLDTPPQPKTYRVNPKLSITRVGTRAYYKALELLAPQIRLDMAQAEDAAKFATNKDDPVLRKCVALSQRIAAALQQQPGHPCSLEDLVVILYAIQNGFADEIPVSEVPAAIADILEHVHTTAGSALEEIAESKILTASASKRIADALVGYSGAKKQQRAVTAAQ